MPHSHKAFRGEIPKDEPHLLPVDNARLAVNCDFSSRKLTPLRDGTLVQTMANNPVRGLYTEDGLLFYTWPAETYAFPSPIIGDTFERVYYLTPSEGLLRVTTKAGMATNGPSPSASWRVGVPKPTVAPVLRTVERTSLPDFPSATATARAWWVIDGRRYGEQDVALSTVTAWRRYTFTTPAIPGDAPAGATAVLEVNLRFLDGANSNAVLMSAIARFGVPGTSRSLPGGVEVSLSPAAVGAPSTIDVAWAAVAASAYTYTYENTWGEESGNAPPAVISANYMQAVSITVTAGDFTGYRPFSKVNVYRTYGGGQAYVRTAVTGTMPTFQDNSTTPASVGSAMESADWLPPEAGIEGFKIHPSAGWLAMFKDRTLSITEPNKPHAVAYSTVFANDIRGIEIAQGGLVVTTAGGPFLLPGTTPASMIRQPVPLDLPQQGIAQRSMVNVDGAAAYASRDGLPLVSGSMATMDASQKLFNRRTWRERYAQILDDASMRLAFFDGSIVATSHTQPLGFTLRLDDNVGELSRLEQTYDATFMLPVNDALYFSRGNQVFRWGTGAALTMDWWGRDWLYPEEISIGAVRIRCDGPVRMRIYCDDTVVFDETVTSGVHRVIPIEGRRWSFRLTGTSAVTELKWARTAGELKRVD